MSKDRGIGGIEKFCMDLDLYSQSLMEKLYKGELVIKELGSVLICRKTDFHTLDGKRRDLYEYCDTFKILCWTHWYRNSCGPKALIFDDKYKRCLTKAIERNRIIVRISDDFVWEDGRPIAMSEYLMTAFAFFYRQEGDAKKAIRKTKTVFEIPPFIESMWSEEKFKDAFYSYLYKKEKFNRNQTKPNLPA